MVMLFEVNLVAVVAAAVASMVLGMIWYGPLFGKKWMELTGKKMDGKKEGMMKSYAIMFIGSLVAACVLGFFVRTAGALDIMNGALVGVTAWLGFVATVTLGMVLWDGKPWSLYVLNNGYQLINFAIMGAILASMG